jgi:hypothetical protein
MAGRKRVPLGFCLQKFKLKYASDSHDLPPGYIYSNVYTFISANSRALGRAEGEKGHKRARSRQLRHVRKGNSQAMKRSAC